MLSNQVHSSLSTLFYYQIKKRFSRIFKLDFCCFWYFLSSSTYRIRWNIPNREVFPDVKKTTTTPLTETRFFRRIFFLKCNFMSELWKFEKKNPTKNSPLPLTIYFITVPLSIERISISTNCFRPTVTVPRCLILVFKLFVNQLAKSFASRLQNSQRVPLTNLIPMAIQS